VAGLSVSAPGCTWVSKSVAVSVILLLPLILLLLPGTLQPLVCSFVVSKEDEVAEEVVVSLVCTLHADVAF